MLPSGQIPVSDAFAVACAPAPRASSTQSDEVREERSSMGSFRDSEGRFYSIAMRNINVALAAGGEDERFARRFASPSGGERGDLRVCFRSPARRRRAAGGGAARRGSG